MVVEQAHYVGDGGGDLGFAGIGFGAGAGLDVAGRDGEDDVVGLCDDFLLAFFGGHVFEGGLGLLELEHLGIELVGGGFDVDCVGVVDDGFSGDEERVAQRRVGHRRADLRGSREEKKDCGQQN